MNPNSYATYLQVLRSTIPDVHSLEIRIVAIIEGTSIGIEFIGED